MAISSLRRRTRRCRRQRHGHPGPDAEHRQRHLERQPDQLQQPSGASATAPATTAPTSPAPPRAPTRSLAATSATPSAPSSPPPTPAAPPRHLQRNPAIAATPADGLLQPPRPAPGDRTGRPLRRQRIEVLRHAVHLQLGRQPRRRRSWPLGTGQTLDFTFTQAATKYVTLTVTDATNQTATIEHDVVVSAPPAPHLRTRTAGVSGTTTQGQTLSTSNGTWSGSPTGYSYQWRECDSSATTAPTSPARPRAATRSPAATSATPSAPRHRHQRRRLHLSHLNATAAIAATPPTASFTSSPGSPVTGQAVHFDASASKCYATPCTYSWADSPAGGGSGLSEPARHSTSPSPSRHQVRHADRHRRHEPNRNDRA